MDVILYNKDIVDSENYLLKTLPNGEFALSSDDNIKYDVVNHCYDFANNLIFGYYFKSKVGYFLNTSEVIVIGILVYINKELVIDLGYVFKDDIWQIIKTQKISEELKNKNIDIITKVLDEVYYNKYELEYDDTIFDGLDIIIYYSDIQIKNITQTHNIKDLFIKISFDEMFVIKNKILGLRTTVTDIEFVCRYCHSHLPTSSSFDWSNFCLGSGIIRDCFSDLIFENSNITHASFLKLLINIDINYISWESITGKPYIRMSTLKNKTDLVDIDEWSIERRYKSLKDKIDLKIKYKKSNSTIDSLHVDKEYLEDCLLSLLEDGYLCNKDTITNEYFNEILSSEVTFHETKIVLTFKEVDYYSTITTSHLSVGGEKFVHPQIINYFYTQLNKELNDFYFKTIRQNP